MTAVRLGDVCQQARESVKPGERPELRYIGLESIESGSGVFAVGELSKTPEVPMANSFRFGPEHVLYGKLRPYLNKVALPNFEGKCSTEIIPLLPSSSVQREYLAYFLRSGKVVDLISARTAGARMPRADMDFIFSLPIPLPPLPEQHRIVDLLSRAEGIVRLRREASRCAAELIPALFLDMFGDPATNPKGFNHVPLGELIKVKSGDFLPAEKMDGSGSIPVYGGNGISGCHSSALFSEPMVIIGRVGAHCGNVHLTKSPCWITDNALYVSDRYRPLSDRFLVHGLRALHLNQYASRAAQPLVSGGRIYPVRMIVPDAALQEMFGSRVCEIEAIQSLQAGAISKAQATFDALLAQAFSPA